VIASSVTETRAPVAVAPDTRPSVTFIPADASGVARIVIDRPGDPVNAIDLRLMEDLAAAIAAARNAAPRGLVVASGKDGEIGQAGGKTESETIHKDMIFYGKENEMALVTVPLHDRNGDAVAAVKVVMKTFTGQTEENAITRAMPIVKEMQARVPAVKNLLE